jgi:hypothetical protein
MENLEIKETEFTPRVKFDWSNNYFEFDGVSRPENVFLFYEPLIDWMTTYESELYKIHVSQGKKFTVEVVFKFSYFNSASAKMIYNMLECLSRIRRMGFTLSIDWYCEDGDDQMREDGEELSEAIDIPFNFKVD